MRFYMHGLPFLRFPKVPVVTSSSSCCFDFTIVDLSSSIFELGFQIFHPKSTDHWQTHARSLLPETAVDLCEIMLAVEKQIRLTSKQKVYISIFEHF